MILLLFSLLFCLSGPVFSISFGPVNIGDSRIPLALRSFNIEIEQNEKSVKAVFVKGSVQWIRTKENLLIPRARLAIIINDLKKKFHIHYSGETILPQVRRNKYYTEIFINLFNPKEMIIKSKGDLFSKISITAKPVKKGKKSKLIDYSCSRYAIKIKGLDDQYLSLGCRMERRGAYGKERPRLIVMWTTSNYTLLDGTPPPYISFFNTSHPVKLNLKDKKGTIREVTISAKVPKRLHRLKTAYGFGPYAFSSSRFDQKIENIAPTFMIYGKYDFTKTVSLRFFDALVYNKSIFNNSGIYFAYHLADILDGRVSIVPLLGFQGLYYKHYSAPNASNNLIYPQGFEVVLRHIFDIENYNVVYGMFFSTSGREEYTNSWVRWGKSYFWELNYINWAKDENKTQMFGLSIGFPFKQFF